MGASALAAAGIVTGVLGNLSAGRAQRDQADYQAEIAQQQAGYERAASESEADEFLRSQRRLLATARARRGGSGVDLTSGSPLLVDEDTIDEIAFQTARIRHGGEVQATRLEQGAQLRRAQGKAAQRASYFRAGSSLLTGASEFG